MAGIGLDGLFWGWGLLDHWTIEVSVGDVCLIFLAEKFARGVTIGFMGRGEMDMKGEGIVLAPFKWVGGKCPSIVLPKKKHHNIIPLPASCQI